MLNPPRRGSRRAKPRPRPREGGDPSPRNTEQRVSWHAAQLSRGKKSARKLVGGRIGCIRGHALAATLHHNHIHDPRDVHLHVAFSVSAHVSAHASARRTDGETDARRRDGVCEKKTAVKSSSASLKGADVLQAWRVDVLVAYGAGLKGLYRRYRAKRAHCTHHTLSQTATGAQHSAVVVVIL